MVRQHTKVRMETRDREQQVRRRRQGMYSPVVDRRKRFQRKQRSRVHGPRSLAARSDQPSELLHSSCYIYSSRACLVCSISPSHTCMFCSRLSLCLYVCLRAVFHLVVSFYPIPWRSMTASLARQMMVATAMCSVTKVYIVSKWIHSSSNMISYSNEEDGRLQRSHRWNAGTRR
jgi:hypothetical protein